MVHHYSKLVDEVYVNSYSYDTLSLLYADYDNIKVLHDDEIKPAPDAENPYLYNFPPLSEQDYWYYPINPNDKFTWMVNDPKHLVNKGRYSAYTVPLWDRQLYELADLPFSVRYTGFRMPKDNPGSEELYNKLYNGRPYILVSNKMWQEGVAAPIMLNEVRSAFSLDNDVDVIYVDTTTNLLHYEKLIANAEEIHVVPSSFHCFSDSIPTKPGAKMFFHDIRADVIMRLNTIWNKDKQWIEINYSRKM
jgi:hypothetical protein